MCSCSRSPRSARSFRKQVSRGPAGLAAVAIGGVLTLGLVRRWGEVFQRWTLFLLGKRVPVHLAVVPASLISVLVTAAGLMFVRLMLFGSFRVGGISLKLDENWAAIAPELLWLPWGVNARLLLSQARRVPTLRART